MTRKQSSTSINLAATAVVYSSEHLNTLDDKWENYHKASRSDYCKKLFAISLNHIGNVNNGYHANKIN